MTKRGDVIVVRFPYAGGVGSKVRPAVVVQCDRLNLQIHNTIAAVVTGNTKMIGIEPTQFLVDPSTNEGASSGIPYASAVSCENLATIRQADIIKTIGQLSAHHLTQLNN